jgi:hypothetical protein
MLKFNVPLTGRPRHSSPRFSVRPASPVHPLWGGDGLGALDTVSGRAEQKTALGDTAGTFFIRRPKSLWGTVLETRLKTEDALTFEYKITSFLPSV